MNSEIFLRTHRETWNRLNLILEQINHKGPSGLPEDDLKVFGSLFRRVTSHLAYAQANFPGHDMIGYLNNLIVKAHGHIYKQESLGIYMLKDFFRRDFPRLIKRQGHYIMLAGLVFILGLITGYFLHFFQPALDGWIIPDNVKKMIGEKIGQGKVGAEWPVSIRPLLSSMIMINNIRVGCLAFALAFTWGIGTLYILFYNGLLIGVLGGIYTSYGYTLDFWSLILPHGFLELAAIFICGGAGFCLAEALVKPGDYTRRDALLMQGKIAVKLVMGTIPLFIIAALIEGFITPSLLPNYGKLIFAVCTLAAFFVYIFRLKEVRA